MGCGEGTKTPTFNPGAGLQFDDAGNELPAWLTVFSPIFGAIGHTETDGHEAVRPRLVTVFQFLNKDGIRNTGAQPFPGVRDERAAPPVPALGAETCAECFEFECFYKLKRAALRKGERLEILNRDVIFAVMKDETVL